MDFTILFQRFAEQSPLIILCGLIIWQLLKMYKEEKALVRTERKEHEQKIQELNTYVREREIEHIETLNSLSVIMNSIDEKMEKISTVL
tara:strand:- start:1407 stop:1673 length:267 start_codon:yes stop_codon:yes gene_type:complete